MASPPLTHQTVSTESPGVKKRWACLANRARRHLDLSGNISSQQFLLDGVVQCCTHKSEQITQGAGTRDRTRSTRQVFSRSIAPCPSSPARRPSPVHSTDRLSAIRLATRECFVLVAHAASVCPVPVGHASAPTAHTREGRLPHARLRDLRQPIPHVLLDSGCRAVNANSFALQIL